MNLYFNLAASDPASALVRSELQTTPAQSPVFTLGDNPEITLYLTDGAGGIHADSGDASITPWLGIGTPGATPTGGTFYLGSGTQTSGTVTSGKRYLISDFNAGDDFTNIGASANATGCIFTASGTTPTTWANGSTLIEITSNLAYDASAATIQTALNALACITAQGGVTVAASSTAPFVFIVDWVTVGDKEELTASGSGLTPDASALIATLQAGDSVTRERQMLRLMRQPAALQSSWTSSGNHWTARLGCNTRGLVDLLAGAASVSAKLELQLVDGDGNISTVGQVTCLVRNEVVDPAALVPAPSASYLTAAQCNLAFVQNRYAVTGLTGGGTALDGIATGTTAAPTVATSVLACIELSGVLSFYELVTGTDAESSPDVILPDDYHGTNNARVWKLRGVSATPSAHASSHASGGSDPVTLAQSQVTNLTTDLAAKQPIDATLTALAGLSVSANTLVQGTGSDSFQMTSFAANKFPARSSSGSLAAKDITDYALTLLDDSDAATARTTLGLGSIATQASSSVSISGGSISGITDLAVADGGTGASDAANARTNLGAASTGANTFSGLQDFSGTGHAGLKLNSLTTTQRDALTPANGMLIYNTTDAKVQKYEAGAWADVGSGSGAALELYVENPSSPLGVTAAGTNAVAIGQYSTASGDDSVAIAGGTAQADQSVVIGRVSLADVVGKLVVSPPVNIALRAQGSAQMGILVVGAETTDGTQTELLVEGPHRLTLRNTSTFAFSIMLAARRTDADGENDAWELKGLIHRDANAASTTLDALQSNQIGSTSWSVAVDADTTNGSLRVRVTGESSKTIRWVATITTTEVSE